MNRERLEIAEKFLRTAPLHADGPDANFNMYDWFNQLELPTAPTLDCGYAGCLMGWTPVMFPDLVTLGEAPALEPYWPNAKSEGFVFNGKGYGEKGWILAQHLFEIDAITANRLTMPDEYGAEDIITPTMVADRIRELLDTGSLRALTDDDWLYEDSNERDI
jgi:hypothetical protein